MAKNPMQTTGDIRRLLADTLADLKSGDLSVDRGMAIAAVGKVMNDSLATEIKLHQVNNTLLESGRKMAELTHLGRAVIADAPQLPSEIEHKPQFEPQDK